MIEKYAHNSFFVFFTPYFIHNQQFTRVAIKLSLTICQLFAFISNAHGRYIAEWQALQRTVNIDYVGFNPF